MSVSVEMTEDFERDCAHTAEVIMASLVKNEEWTSFLLYDVSVNLFDSSFITTVARYLGGRVENDVILYEDMTIRFEFTTSRVIYGFYDDIEITINFE
jgi:hypothetical protein